MVRTLTLEDRRKIELIWKCNASPDVLGEFLASLTVATRPWDKGFHRSFNERMMFHRPLLASTSRPSVGSSRKRISGSMIRAMPMLSLLC